MKLLLDQNLSHHLIEPLSSSFSEVEHVRNLDLHTAMDTEIWDVAKQQHFTIVSKDSDFWERAVLDGPPPKIIWIRLGNCTTKEIKSLLKDNISTIQEFGRDKNEALLTLE